MPLIVACPSCEGQLRVADDLLGKKVRCPSCRTTFDAATPANGTAETHPAGEPEPRPAWKDLPLQLSLDDPSPSGEPPAPRQTPGLVGAIELGRTADDGAPDPGPEPEAPAPSLPERTSRPKLSDDHDDLKECPGCGRHIHRDARRCYDCGERFDDDPPRPLLRRRSAVRRDCEPHRGSAILIVGIISLVCGVVFGPAGVVCGLVAWVMGHTDLRKIKAREMDPEGHGPTQAGWICGILGTALSTLWTLGCAGFWIMIIFATPTPTTRPRGAPVPVQQWPQPPPPNFNPPPRRFNPPPPRPINPQPPVRPVPPRRWPRR